MCFDGMKTTIRNYCLGFVGLAVAALLSNVAQAPLTPPTPPPPLSYS